MAAKLRLRPTVEAGLRAEPGVVRPPRAPLGHVDRLLSLPPGVTSLEFLQRDDRIRVRVYLDSGALTKRVFCASPRLRRHLSMTATLIDADIVLAYDERATAKGTRAQLLQKFPGKRWSLICGRGEAVPAEFCRSYERCIRR